VCFRVQAFKRAHDSRLSRARTPCIYFYSSLCKSLTRCQACRSAGVIQPSRRRIISVPLPEIRCCTVARRIIASCVHARERISRSAFERREAPRFRSFARSATDVSNPCATGRERNLTRDLPLIEKTIVRKWRSYNRQDRSGDLAQQQ